MEGYIGFIQWFAGNFAPQGWALCQGQVLRIDQNTMLFSLLGTTYGGDGQMSFQLPDFQGRAAVGAGQGAGLSNYALGQAGGSERTIITVDNLPPHSHTLKGSGSSDKKADLAAPAGSFLAETGNINKKGYTTPDAMVAMSPKAIAPNGGNQPFDNRQSYLGMNFIICFQGLFPTRN